MSTYPHPQNLPSHPPQALISRRSGIRALVYGLLTLLLTGISSIGVGAVQVHSDYRTIAEALTHAQGLAYVPFIICGVLSLIALLLTLIYGVRGARALRLEGHSTWGWISVALLILACLAVLFVVLPLVFGLVIALAVTLSV